MRVPGFSYCRLRRAVEVGCSTELTSLEFESDSSGDSEDVAVRATPNQKRECCRACCEFPAQVGLLRRVLRHDAVAPSRPR